jgi:hypothetical protein
MTRYVALLRGINVGGKNLIKMAALRACFEELGFSDVATYIQSGNVLFRTGGKRAELTARIEGALAETFSYQASVVLRSKKQMQGIVAGAPEGLRLRAGRISIRRPLLEEAADRGDRDEDRTGARGCRRRAGWHRRSVLLEADQRGQPQPAEQDRVAADLPADDDPELEDDDEAAGDDVERVRLTAAMAT